MDSDAEHRPEQRIRLQAVTAIGRGEGFFFCSLLTTVAVIKLGKQEKRCFLDIFLKV